MNNNEKLQLLGGELSGSKPLEACKALAMDGSPEAVPWLALALQNKDEQTRTLAEESLRKLSMPESIDELCEVIIAGNNAEAARIIKDKKYMHSIAGRMSLVYLFIGNTKSLFETDHNFVNMKAVYHNAPENLKRRIKDIIKESNNCDLARFFKPPDIQPLVLRPSGEMTDEETDILIEVYRRNQKWDAIFELLAFLKLGQVRTALTVLSESGWKPLDEADAVLYANLLALLPKLQPEIFIEQKIQNPVLNEWKRVGESEEYLKKEDKELRNLVPNGTPIEAICSLFALQKKGVLAVAEVSALQKHRHWLVRLAALVFFSDALKLHELQEYSAASENVIWVKDLVPYVEKGVVMNKRAKWLRPSEMQSIEVLRESYKKREDKFLAAIEVLCLLGVREIGDVVSISKDAGVIIEDGSIGLEKTR